MTQTHTSNLAGARGQEAWSQRERQSLFVVALVSRFEDCFSFSFSFGFFFFFFFFFPGGGGISSEGGGLFSW